MPKEAINILVLDVDNSGLVAHRSRSSRQSPPHLLSEFLVDEAKSPTLIEGQYRGFYVSTHRSLTGSRGKENIPGIIESNIQNLEAIRNYVVKYPRMADEYPADFSAADPDDEFTSSFIKNFSAATKKKLVKVSTPGDIYHSCGYVFDKFLSTYEKEVMATKKKIQCVKNINGSKISGVWTSYDFARPAEFKEKLFEDKIDGSSKNQQYIQIAKDAAKLFPDKQIRLVIMDDSVPILTAGLKILPEQLPQNMILDFYKHDSYGLYDDLARNLDSQPFIKIGAISTIEESVELGKESKLSGGGFAQNPQRSMFQGAAKPVLDKVADSLSSFSLGKRAI